MQPGGVHVQDTDLMLHTLLELGESMLADGADVRRVEHLRLRWRDENFEPHEKEFSGFIARIIQHECDHLEGRMFIDHISPTRRFLNKRKLTNIVEGKTRVDYPAKYAPVGRRK